MISKTGTQKQHCTWKNVAIEEERMVNTFTAWLATISLNRCTRFLVISEKDAHHWIMSLNRCPGITFIREADAHHSIMTFEKKLKEGIIFVTHN